MTINDLIKQLNAIKKAHGGDLSCDIMNGVTGNFSSINSLSLIYPTDPKSGGYDRTQKPWGIWVSDHKSS